MVGPPSPATPSPPHTTTPAQGGQTPRRRPPHLVTGLTNGDTYTFTVTATNGAGPDTASAPATGTTADHRPGADRGGYHLCHTSASISWTAPANNGGATITGYTVTSDITGAPRPPTAGATTCTVTGLTNGTAYTFTVTATNRAGTGFGFDAVQLDHAGGTPGAPTGVRATAVATSATITWTDPTNTGGGALTGYTVTATSATPGPGHQPSTGRRPPAPSPG